MFATSNPQRKPAKRSSRVSHVPGGARGNSLLSRGTYPAPGQKRIRGGAAVDSAHFPAFPGSASLPAKRVVRVFGLFPFPRPKNSHPEAAVGTREVRRPFRGISLRERNAPPRPGVSLVPAERTGYEARSLAWASSLVGGPRAARDDVLITPVTRSEHPASLTNSNSGRPCGIPETCAATRSPVVGAAARTTRRTRPIAGDPDG